MSEQKKFSYVRNHGSVLQDGVFDQIFDVALFDFVDGATDENKFIFVEAPLEEFILDLDKWIVNNDKDWTKCDGLSGDIVAEMWYCAVYLIPNKDTALITEEFCDEMQLNNVTFDYK